MSPREIVAIVEDDPDILKLVTETLDKGGLETLGFTRGDDFLRHTKRRTPDAVVLDLMLPDTDGLSICRQLRAAPETAQMPVLILTAKGEETDKVLGLELGADDYVTKPFSPRELLARVRALLRRSRVARTAGTEGAEHLYEFAGWQLDAMRRDLRDPAGVLVNLSDGEFSLLRSFVEHPQRVLSRDQLLDMARGRDTDVYDRTIDNQVSRLRRKIEDDAASPRIIATIRAGGYSLATDVREVN